MEALAERLYRRWPTKYMGILSWVATAIAYVMLLPLGLVLLDGEVGLTDRETAEMLGVLAVGTFVAMFGAQLSTRRRRRPALAWAGGDRSDPTAAWGAMQAAPRALSSRYVSLLVPIAVVGFNWAIRRHDPTLATRAGLTASVLVAALAGWIIAMLGFEAATRPMLAECAAAIDEEHPPAPGWGLRARLLLVLGAFGLAVGMASAIAVSGLDVAQDHVVLVSIGIAAVTTLYGMAFYAGLVLPSVLRPLGDLFEATARVADGDYDQPVPVASADELGDVASSFNAMQRGLRERASLHAAFGTFVDPALTSRLLELGDEAFTGELVAVSVLFVDVRGFTTFAGTVEPEEAVTLLNQLFGVVVPIVRHHRGHPNHFLGDGLLAVFGAPEPLEDHADHAVAAAREVQHAVFAQFGESLRVGVGINSGEVIAGTIGGGGKLEYTVIGDAVNLAARVEQLTKVTGDAILVTEATGALLSDHRDLVDKGRHELRGKAEPVHLFAVRC
jgi:adenylate cyclase